MVCCVFKQTYSAIQFKNAKRVLHPSGRHLMHMHLESASIYGNSTDLMYFYSNVEVGDFDNPSIQSLIIDTGSGLTCFPCEKYCSMCGKHIHKYYPVDKSKTKEILSCKKENCSCILDDKCEFSIHYGEGSSYTGFWVVDDIYFGESADKEDKQRFQFGCVTKETNLFFTQDADGIMGLTTGNGKIQPIYTHLYEKGLVEKEEFTLCLGKNGGKFIIGGLDETLKVHPDLPVQWVKLQSTGRYLISILSISIGSDKISNPPSRAMIDSGTTFTYLSQNQYNEIDKIIKQLCSTKKYECKGVREKENCYQFYPNLPLRVWQSDGRLGCLDNIEYGNTKENEGLKEFFESFPVINFQVSSDQVIKWFPSEYFYQERQNLYCLAVDHFAGDSTMVIGGSMMRQYMYSFDIPNVQVGIVRSKCSDDPNMYIYDDPKYTQITNKTSQNQTEPGNNTTGSSNSTIPSNSTESPLSVQPIPSEPSVPQNETSTPSSSKPENETTQSQPSPPLNPESSSAPNKEQPSEVLPSNSSSNNPISVEENVQNQNKTNVVTSEPTNEHICTNCQDPPDNSISFFCFILVLVAIICIAIGIVCFKMKRTNPNKMVIFNDVDIQVDQKSEGPNNNYKVDNIPE